MIIFESKKRKEEIKTLQFQVRTLQEQVLKLRKDSAVYKAALKLAFNLPDHIYID
jgi:hypothetical protein